MLGFKSLKVFAFLSKKTVLTLIWVGCNFTPHSHTAGFPLTTQKR